MMSPLNGVGGKIQKKEERRGALHKTGVRNPLPTMIWHRTIFSETRCV